MNRCELDIVQQIFSIAMHSIKTEELILQQEIIDRHKQGVIETATAVISYERDLITRGELINQKRTELFELYDRLMFKEVER